MAREITPVTRSFCRHRGCTFAKWHVWCLREEEDGDACERFLDGRDMGSGGSRSDQLLLTTPIPRDPRSSL